MNQKEHLKNIALLCDDIERCLFAIENNVHALDKLYGIRIADLGIQCGRNVHVYAGIELVAQALAKTPKETRRSEFGDAYHAFVHRDTEWHQLPKARTTAYLQANYDGGARYDLRMEVKDETP